MNRVILSVVLISILSVELGQGLKCYEGTEGAAKREKDCDDDVENCKTFTNSKSQKEEEEGH